MHHDPTFWLLARAAGLAAYALLTLSILAGLVLKSRPFARLKAATVTEVHKTLALTGLGALCLHAVALVLDSTVKVSLVALVVPGLVAYRPAAVAAGVVAGWLLAIVTASFWLRKRIGIRAWRRLHWFTYALFGLATVHGITAGTDATQPWVRGLYLGALGSVVSATAWRALVPPAARRAVSKGATQ
ncbi:MAG: ferric reductase-like transmembrane domain-containing protein [Gaiellaceae bacterium]